MANEYKTKPGFEEVCVEVESEVADFLRGLIVGGNLEIKRVEQDVDKIDLFEPATYRVCGAKTDMMAVQSNIDSALFGLERRYKYFGKASKKIKSAIRKVK